MSRSMNRGIRGHPRSGDVEARREISGRFDGRLAGGAGAPTATIADAPPARTFLAGEDERRCLERDLHDGVQNELVALIVKFRRAEEDRDTPPALAGTLSALAACAEASLDSVREIAHEIYPSALAAFGVLEALRAQARRASIDASLEGTAPRSTDEAEAAVYFSCSEATQNVAKHAGRAAHVRLRLRHDHGTLAVRVEDDGHGPESAHIPEGAGLGNIRDRIQALRGTVKLTSSPGRGTVLTISLPWPQTARTTRPVRVILDTAPASQNVRALATRPKLDRGLEGTRRSRDIRATHHDAR
jgi:signal transduction histidine kinase